MASIPNSTERQLAKAFGELSLREKIELLNIQCDKERIEYTPALFVDGYELPREYKISDHNVLLNL